MVKIKQETSTPPVVFPLAYRRTKGEIGTVVLFWKENVGVVVKSVGSQHPVGYQSYDWVSCFMSSQWEPIDIEIIH